MVSEGQFSLHYLYLVSIYYISNLLTFGFSCARPPSPPIGDLSFSFFARFAFDFCHLVVMIDEESAAFICGCSSGSTVLTLKVMSQYSG